MLHKRHTRGSNWHIYSPLSDAAAGAAFAAGLDAAEDAALGADADVAAATD